MAYRAISLGLMFGLTCVAFLTPATASDSNGAGRLKNIAASNIGAVSFELDQTFYDIDAKARLQKSVRGSPPSCASGNIKRWVVDASTDEGKAILTTLLWAADHDRYVSVAGTGKCTVASDTETVLSINVL